MSHLVDHRGASTHRPGEIGVDPPVWFVRSWDRTTSLEFIDMIHPRGD